MGSVALFEAGASGVKALSAATGIKALANPAVINSVTMSANTALNGIANGDSWDKVVINTVTSGLSTATGTKIGNLVSNKVVSALNNLGLSERVVNALAASSNGVSFAVTQSALEETKNAFMYGAEYKPDAASIAVNIITSILFGSLEAFKNNPKAAQLQNRLKQGDVSAQKETADFLNKQAESKQNNVSPMDTQQSPTDQPLSAEELAERYKNHWTKAQGVENGDVDGYNFFSSTPELQKHIQYVDPSVPRSRGIGGAHNSKEFFTNDVNIVKSIPSTDIPGVTYYQYNMPLLGKDGWSAGGYGTTIFEKTVYDPSIFSDNDYITRGLEAARDSLKRNGKLEDYWEGYDSRGVKWVGFGENGTPQSFYPYIPKQ